jgi:hypothetical protein
METLSGQSRNGSPLATRSAAPLAGCDAGQPLSSASSAAPTWCPQCVGRYDGESQEWQALRRSMCEEECGQHAREPNGRAGRRNKRI